MLKIQSLRISAPPRSLKNVDLIRNKAAEVASDPLWQQS